MNTKTLGQRSTLFAIALVAVLLLSACVAVDPPGTGGKPTATPAPQPTATGVPHVPPVPEAALAARLALAQQLRVDVAAVTIVSVEKVDWPDSCLGVTTSEMMCAQEITPGYKIMLEVAGKSYEYHTNADGSVVRLASAPDAAPVAAPITWTSTDGPCQTAQIDESGVAFGDCGGALQRGKFAGDVQARRLAEYQDFVMTFAPFEARTPAGQLAFKGTGTTVASWAEQRMIAEWARLAMQEAATGRSGDGAALAWHQEGGIAGLCDDLTLYVYGRVYGSSCKGGQVQDLGSRRLTTDDLVQLYKWVDGLKPFVQESPDAVLAADGMKVRLVFNGRGSADAGDGGKQAMLDFAARLMLGLPPKQ